MAVPLMRSFLLVSTFRTCATVSFAATLTTDDSTSGAHAALEASSAAGTQGAPPEQFQEVEAPWHSRLRATSASQLTPKRATPAALVKKKEEQPDADPDEAEAAAIDAEIAYSERLIANAWDAVRSAPIPGSAKDVAALRSQEGVVARFKDLLFSVAAVEWYFFWVAIILMVSVDIAILQHLPEVERTHLGLFVFWFLISLSFCAEVWLRFGQQQGISWASGYILELIFSAENIFIFNLIFHALETPRRLMRKALFAACIGGVVLRFLFQLGLAESMYNFACMSYVLGAWLMYCGTQQVAYGGRCDEADVTQTPVVKACRQLLGKRFGEFYDEEGENIFVNVGSKMCMTLLGTAVVCLLFTDCFFSLDATLVKLNLIPNPYISFSSSVLALLTLRALFFVVRDILSHLGLARYGTGLILLFVGAEMVAAHFTEVSALMSLIVVVNVLVLMATMSALKDNACPKRAH